MIGGADLDPVVAQATLYSSRNPTRRWLHVSRREWVLNAVRDYTENRYSRALEVGPGAKAHLVDLRAVDHLDVDLIHLPGGDADVAVLMLEHENSARPNLEAFLVVLVDFPGAREMG